MSSNSDELSKQLKKLNEEINQNGNGGKSENDWKQEKINLLHEYNNIKDATQVVLGVLADIDGVTLKKIHEKYNLPLES